MLRLASLKVIALVVVACVAFWVSWADTTTNSWSLHAARILSRGGSHQAPMEPAPAGHQRGPLWRGRAALDDGDTTSAIDILRQGLEVSPQDSLARAELGRAYSTQGVVVEAAAEWRRAGAWYELLREGQRALAVRRWDDAIFLFSVAAEGLGEEAVAYEAMALRGGRSGADAISLLRWSLAEQAQSHQRQQWLTLLGQYLGEQGLWDEAAFSYREAIDTEDGDSRWLALIGYGKAQYFTRGALDDAVSLIREGIALRTDRAEGYIAMGDLLRQERRYDEADGWYRDASDRDVGNVWVHVRRVDNLLLLGRTSQALELLEQMIQAFPSEAHPYYLLGQVYGARGELDLAVPAAERSVELDRTGNAGYRDALLALYERSSAAGAARQDVAMWQQRTPPMTLT